MRASSIESRRVAPRTLGTERPVLDRPPRILLVDDEQSIQTLLSYPLRKDGYEVVQATDGREALARFGESTFDLVVLDVMMPRLDGLEVCRGLGARGPRGPRRASQPTIPPGRGGDFQRSRGPAPAPTDHTTIPFPVP